MMRSATDISRTSRHSVFRRALALCSIITLAEISTPTLAAPALNVAPVAATSSGPIHGLVNSGVAEFLGIPYAAPPVGALRWQPPQPHPAWALGLNATKFGPTCAQFTELGVFAGPANTNEDCLYLNVFAPRNASRALPVFVWLHGGGLVDGESNDYDGTKLALQGTVVVTINYRLGLLGYLAHPALDKEGHAFGNYGLLDQQAALRWVHQNIAAFGGDPNNVTLGGQSAGATSTGANVISPSAAGLFHRAIFESGPLLTIAPLSLAEQRGTAFGTAAGCTGSDSATAACLRALPVAKILALQGTASGNGPYVNGLMVDGTTIPQPADRAFASGEFNRMPIMNGTVEDEGNFGIGITEYFSGPPQTPLTLPQYVADVYSTYSGDAGPGGGPPAYPIGDVSAVLAHYPLSAYGTPQLVYDAVTTHPTACRARYLNRLLERWVPVYAYEFDDRSAPYYFPTMPGFVPLAAHTIDIQFLFPLWHGGPLGIAHPLNAQEQQLSNVLVRAWTQFAATGNPNATGNVSWPRYTSTAGAPAYLSENVPSSSSFTDAQFVSNHQCNFWDGVLDF